MYTSTKSLESDQNFESALFRSFSASLEDTSLPKSLAASISILDFLNILLGLKKSPIPFVETPHDPLKEIIDGFSHINIETDPAP